MTGFVVGLFVGAVLGFWGCAILASGKRRAPEPVEPAHIVFPPERERLRVIRSRVHRALREHVTTNAPHGLRLWS